MKVEIKRSNRKTVSIEVAAGPRVLVRAPYRMSDQEIQSFLDGKYEWIRKNVEQVTIKQKEREALPKITMDEVRKLADQALKVLPPKVAFYAELMSVAYNRITVRNQKSRWGSCSTKGNLNFNCLLMLTPDEVQDYIVVHELCHRKEMNHSARFWAEVEKVLPDYRDREKWLKKHGGDIISRME